MAPMSLPPGFRFHPTDEELVAYYLDRKINGRTIELDIIPEVDLYKCEPWDLPEKSFLPSKDMEWYFYSPRDKKYPNGSRTNRATRAGYWKATGKDRPVHSLKKAVGMKKTLVYYRGRAPHGIRTNWVMHEYRLLHTSSTTPTLPSTCNLKDSYALCRIFKKNIQIMGKTKKEEGVEDNNEVKEVEGWVSEASGNENSIRRRREDVEDENLNTCYSDVTQGTPNETGSGSMPDDYQPPFTASDEAHSSPFLASLGNTMDFRPSNLFHHHHHHHHQEMQMGEYTTVVEYQVPYPPLELEDFPQINISETKTSTKVEIMDEYMIMYEKYINGSLEDIFTLCSSQSQSQSQSQDSNSMPLGLTSNIHP